MAKDLRAHPEQDQEHEGASVGEILIEAARRNNTDLLKETIDSIGDEDKVAKILNETKTVLGNYIYHEAALRGNCTSIHFHFYLYPSRPMHLYLKPTSLPK